MACTSPIYIINPNVVITSRHRGSSYNSRTGEYFGERDDVSLRVCDPTKSSERYIAVPCGHCDACLRTRQLYFVQRCQGEVIAGNDLYYFTLTYNQQSIPKLSIGDKTYLHVDFRDVALMFKRIRKDNLFGVPFKYIVLNELGGTRHRPHFHGIISAPPLHQDESLAEKVSRGLQWHDIVLKEWRRNVGSRRSPIWQPLCDVVIRRGRIVTFDFHYVEPGYSENGPLDCAFYVSKYMMKPDDTLEKLRSYLKLNYDVSEYLDYWRLLRPTYQASKRFGSPDHSAVKEHINRSIDFAIAENSSFPYWINPDSGMTFPLCTYYRRNVLDKDIMKKLDLYYAWDGREFNTKKLPEILRDQERTDRIRDAIKKRDLFDYYEF